MYGLEAPGSLPSDNSRISTLHKPCSKSKAAANDSLQTQAPDASHDNTQ